MSEPLQNDTGSNYLAYRAQVPENAAGDALLKEMAGGEESAGTPQAPATTPQTMPAVQGNIVGRAAKDIGKGVVETPRAIYTGARDAVANTYNTIDDFGQWADKKFGDVTGFRGIYIGKGGMHLMSDQEAGTGMAGLVTGGQGSVPRLGDIARQAVDSKTVADPTSVTGGLIKGVSQFLTGLALTRRAMVGTGLPASISGPLSYGYSAVQGAVANFSAFDPHQQRLSNLIEKFPALSNPVTEFLASKPDDSAATGRFKNALEGLGLGTLTDGFMKGVGMLRGVMNAKGAIEGGAEGAAETVPQGVSPDAFRQLGDESPEAPLVSDKPFGEQAAPTPPQQPFTPPEPGQAPAQSYAGEPTELGNYLKEQHAAAVTKDVNPESILTPSLNTGTVESVEQAEGLPQPQEGFTRLYRAESPDTQAGDVFDLKQLENHRSDLPGKYYTEKSSEAFYYKDAYGPNAKVSYVDVPTSHLEGKEVTPGEYKVDVNAIPAPASKTYINFARINTPEDVQNVMQTLADKYSSKIESSTRGVQSFEDIKLGAQMENAWDILKNRRVGEPLNAEQSVASRELWASSADKLKELAQTATQAPTEENLFAFRKMMATHYAIQSEVIGARTETARALASWRIPVGSSASRLQDITDRMMNLSGGADTVRQMAQHVAGLAQADYPHELEQFVQKSAYVRTRDALIQAFSDGLLSSPVTQSKILASNVSTGIWRIGERAWAAKISQALGTPEGVEPGEAGAMWSGWVGSFKDAMAYGWKAAKTGVTGEGIGEPKEPYPSNISADALNLSDHPWLGRAADFIGNALSLGRRGIAAQHDVALTMAYRGELNAQALRQATSEVNAGELEEGGVAERVADLLQNPTDAMVQTSRDSAKYQAFLDEPGKIAQWLLDGRKEIPALRIIAPFIKIPARIMSYTFERTPLAPLMSEFRSKIAAGGATRDLALAQMSMGSMITMAAADMTLSGNLKGGGPPQKGLEQAQEREGAMRDSVRMGNTWYNINGVHPAGKLMLLAADVAEAITGGQQELHQDADTEKLAVGTALAIGRTMVDNSYFTGFANLFATLHDARVGGAGEGAIQSTVGSMVPAFSGATARALDPYQREIYSMLDEFKSKIPGLSNTLPPRRNIWGEPIPSGHDPITNFISPVKMADVKHEPIDDEILKQGMNITMPDRMQTFGTRGNSIPVDMSKYPAAYSRLLQLAGNELQHPAWNMGLKDLLNGIVSGNHPLSAIYNLKSDGPEGGKEVMVRDLISQYRDLAKKQILQEYPAIAQEVQDKADTRQALKLGALQ